MTWSEALNYCRTHHVDLISIHTYEIQLHVENRVKEASSSHVWIGLRFTCVLNFWFWVSAETLMYQHWAPGNGTGAEKCGTTAAVESGGMKQWVSLPDTEKLNFICCG
ncbi:low affinity immunoglobulin epsilon Fc receptor-like [Scleropages formosus]|nr:low affinity immunoglobulin epsilon Fc receptor-like [Scleropages formosus]